MNKLVWIFPLLIAIWGCGEKAEKIPNKEYMFSKGVKMTYSVAKVVDVYKVEGGLQKEYKYLFVDFGMFSDCVIKISDDLDYFEKVYQGAVDLKSKYDAIFNEHGISEQGLEARKELIQDAYLEVDTNNHENRRYLIKFHKTGKVNNFYLGRNEDVKLKEVRDTCSRSITIDNLLSIRDKALAVEDRVNQELDVLIQDQLHADKVKRKMNEI